MQDTTRQYGLRTFLITCLGMAVVIFAATLAAQTPSQSGEWVTGNIASGTSDTAPLVQLDPTGLTLVASKRSSKGAGAPRMLVRIKGPNGRLLVDQMVTGETYYWAPNGPDGQYRFEAISVRTKSAAGKASGKASRPVSPATAGQPTGPPPRIYGSFRVRDGRVQKPATPPDTKSDRQTGMLSDVERVLGAVLTQMVSSAHAVQTFTEDVEIQDSDPELILDDTDVSGDAWSLKGFDSSFSLFNNMTGEGSIVDIDAGAPFHTFHAMSDGSVSLGRGGDVNLANGSAFIGQTDNNLGIGTTTPGDNIHVLDSRPTLILEDSSDGTKAGLRHDFGLLAIEGDGGDNIVTLETNAPEGSMRIDSTGDVGIGTGSPDEELHISEFQPAIRFEDSDDSITWDQVADNNSYRLLQGGAQPLGIETNAPDHAIFVDSNGEVGLGTNAPNQDLEIKDDNTAIKFNDTTSGEANATIGANGNEFSILGGLTDIASINLDAPGSSLFLGSNGDVGLGTGSPAKQLHVQGASADTLGQNNTMLHVENTTGTQGARRMIELTNNGSPLLVYRDTARGTIWNMSPVGNSFAISLSGTGAQEFQMDGGGNLTIQGSLTEDSSRASKTGFARVDADTVLAKLDNLSIEEWHYKHTPDSRHIGPMAEDFHATFGVGPKDGIAPRDLAGVALAAAKALKDESEMLKAENEELKAWNEKLKAENEKLKARVDEMGQMEGRLERLESRVAALAK